MAEDFELLSINQYVSDGVQTNYEVSFSGGYISREHVLVKVFYDDTLTDGYDPVWSFVSDFTINFPTAPLLGEVIRIYRNTPFTAPLVDFSDGSIINERTMDLNAKQAVFLAAELRDRFGNTTDLETVTAAAQAAEVAAEQAEIAAVAAVASSDEAVATVGSKANASALGTSGSDNNLGLFESPSVPNDVSAKAAIEGLASVVDSLPTDTDVAAVSEASAAGKAQATALGRAGTDNHMGTYTGGTLADNQSAKQNLQSLETAVEARVTTSALAAASGAGLVGYKSGSTAQLRQMEDWIAERGTSVMDFYQTGDPDHTLAFQRAVLALTPTIANGLTVGGLLYVPPGNYTISGPIISETSGDTDLIEPRLSMCGPPGGARSAIINIAAGSFDAFTFIGSNGNGADAQVVIQDINLNKAGNLGTCLVVKQYSHVCLNRIKTNGGTFGIRCIDVQESLFEELMCLWAQFGMRVDAGDFTAPNGMTFLNCKMANNKGIGLHVTNGAAVNILGGSYEGNNTTDLGVLACGIFAQWNPDHQIEGSVGLNVIGAYLEQNGHVGTGVTSAGDILVHNAAGPMSMTVQGCTFQRLGSYCLNNIRLEMFSGLAATLTLSGNGHRAFPFAGGYTPSETRPYVGLVGAENIFVDSGVNIYDSAVERPDFSQYNNMTHGAMAQAKALFSGAGAVGAKTPLSNMNVSLVNKTAEGAYEVTFARPLQTVNYIPLFDLPPNISADVVTKGTSKITFNTRNTSNVVVDAVQIGIVVFDRGL